MKKVILVSGKLRSGKNQFAKYLYEMFTLDGVGVSEDLFARQLKDNSKEDFKELYEYLNEVFRNISTLSENLCDIDDQAYEKLNKICEQHITSPENFYEEKNPITRILLQTYGTEIFRNRVDGNWWVKQLINRVENSDVDVSIITDVRFPNEVDLVNIHEKFEVTKVRINRNLERNDKSNEHLSETSLDDYNDWDYIIENNGTLEDLWDKIDDIYKQIK